MQLEEAVRVSTSPRLAFASPADMFGTDFIHQVPNHDVFTRADL
jgi:hypothetical protein